MPLQKIWKILKYILLSRAKETIDLQIVVGHKNEQVNGMAA